MEYVINLTWDEDAGVWIATSDDIPGLVLESGSFDALLERIRFAAPELIALNNSVHSSYMLSNVIFNHCHNKKVNRPKPMDNGLL